MKYILTALILGGLFLTGCNPEQGTKADKEAVKNDTVDNRQGEGEGDVGERVYGR